MSAKAMGIKKKNFYLQKNTKQINLQPLLLKAKNDEKGKFNFNDRSHCLDVPGM